ncbi:MAG: PfkB family carbohydrate kinase [Deltaproteobacteria bacterium]|nr:PfkB family carbohydrate kinase [Deltaproteobacteria bacterium]
MTAQTLPGTGASHSPSSLLIVGSVGLDTVETVAGRHSDILGGAASYSAVAASFLAPARLVGVVGSDFPDQHVAFMKSRHVDLAGLEVAEGKTFRWSGKYAPDFSTRTTLDTQLNVFSTFKPKLPAAWKDSEFVFLANIDPELQLDVLQQVTRPRFVACDTMNFWIEGKREALGRLLQKVDMLLLNDEEARQLSGLSSLPAAARAIRKMGPSAVVIKRGDAGALLFHEGGVFAAPAFPIETVVDPTGAGDSFAGGFMGWLARMGGTSPADIRTALILGSVLASYCVEDFSLNRFQTLDLTGVRDRFAAFADLVHFEKIRL